MKNGGNGFLNIFGQFTLTAVDGMNGFMGRRDARPDEYESTAKALLREMPDAMQVVVLDGEGNYFDFVLRE